jgi:molybdopterin-guanine dinucleotide biosynthesis protein A
MPLLRPEIVRLVVERAGAGDVVIPRVHGLYETLHAAYRKTCLPPMQERLNRGRLKIVDFFDAVQVVPIEEDELGRYGDPDIVFMNVNTPQELERARALAARSAG